MRLFVYDMLVNVNVIYYVHVCEQARWARSAGNSAIENLCIIFNTLESRFGAPIIPSPVENWLLSFPPSLSLSLIGGCQQQA